MTYGEAVRILEEYMMEEYDNLDDPWYNVLDTAYSALIQCLEDGLLAPPEEGE